MTSILAGFLLVSLRMFNRCTTVLRVPLFTLAFIGLTAISAWAQTPFSATFTLAGNGNNVSSLPYNGEEFSNIEISSLDKVGITSSSSSGNFRGSNWPLGATSGSNDFTGSINLESYIEFTISAAEDYVLDLISLTFGIGRSAAGPRQWEWRSSADDYAGAISIYTSINSNLTLTDGVLTNPDDNSSWTGNILDLSGSLFQNLETITFRLYGYNAEGIAGTGGLQGNLSFSGTVKSGLPFTGYVWTGTGSGSNWENGQQGHFDAPYVNASDTPTQFEGIGETIAVVGTVQTSSIEILDTDFVFEGGTIDLEDGILVAASGTNTRIASVLDGQNGLTKLGTGVVELEAENTFAGPVNIGAGVIAISQDENLGHSTNPVVFSGGKLEVKDDMALSVDRIVSGSGTIAIPEGKTLSAAGEFALTNLTLSGAGTLDLQGISQSVGNLTVLVPATMQGSDYVGLTSLSATSLNGIFTIESSLDLSGGGNRIFDIGSNGVVVLNGADIFSGARIQKNGTGILQLNGENLSLGGLSIGLAGGAYAGTVQVSTDTGLGTFEQLYHNSGTLEAIGDREFAIGISLGGRSATPGILMGGAMVFNGNFSMFTSGTAYSRMDVHNVTTFNGSVTNGNAVEGGGVLFGGDGRLIMNGDGSGLTIKTVVRDTLEFVVNNLWGSEISVEAQAILKGAGIIAGPISGNGMVSPGFQTPGILTAQAVDGALGTRFDFGFSTELPDYLNPGDSLNSILYLTGETPFASALDLDNTIRLFIAAETLLQTSTYLGGFFTEADSLESIEGANFEYYILGDGFGLAATYNGDGYYSLAQFNALQDSDFSFVLGSLEQFQIALPGTEENFVDGHITTFTVIPEPSSAALLLFASLGLWKLRRNAMRKA